MLLQARARAGARGKRIEKKVVGVGGLERGSTAADAPVIETSVKQQEAEKQSQTTEKQQVIIPEDDSCARCSALRRPPANGLDGWRRDSVGGIRSGRNKMEECDRRGRAGRKLWRTGM